MTRYKIKMVIKYLLAVCLIICLIYSTFFEPNRLLKDAQVKGLNITFLDIKAGLEAPKRETVITTDKQEINEFISTLKKPILYKKLPNIGGVPANSNNRLGLMIIVVLDNNKVIAYYVTSQGDIEVTRNNNSFNAGVLCGNSITWFEQLKELYDSKKQNENL